MFSRLLFLFITLFWMTMSFLLWRSEFAAPKRVGSAVSLDMVVEKILTAPDASSLEVYHHGKKIGFCRLAASVGMQGSKNLSDDFQPEGMVIKPTSYRLDLEGNVTLAETTNRLRFDLGLKLSTNRTWQEFDLRATHRPDSWELHTSAVDQKVRFVVDDGVERWEQGFTFVELRNPQVLLREFGGPLALTVLGSLGNIGLGNLGNTNSANPILALKWEANNDSMRFGHSKVRVFRLHTKIFERYDVFIFVSRVGEILWVELPDQIILSNDAFTHF